MLLNWINHHFLSLFTLYDSTPHPIPSNHSWSSHPSTLSLSLSRSLSHILHSHSCWLVLTFSGTRASSLLFITRAICIPAPVLPETNKLFLASRPFLRPGFYRREFLRGRRRGERKRTRERERGLPSTWTLSYTCPLKKRGGGKGLSLWGWVRAKVRGSFGAVG